MFKAIKINRYGSVDELKYENINLKKLSKNELLIKQISIGVNYHDIYVRKGLYKTLKLPGIPGCEAVGIIEDKGKDVKNFKLGDKIAYVTKNYGAYTTHRILEQDYAVKVPHNLSNDLIATNFLRAMTVDMLFNYVINKKNVEKIFVTAVTGGVGRILCQIGKKYGYEIYGSVSSLDKQKKAKNYGCEYTLINNKDNIPKEINEITNGEGVDIVFDSVGGETITTSLSILKKRGHLVNFGQSSGVINSINISNLAEKSLTFSRPILFHYLENKKNYNKIANSAFKMLKMNLIFPSKISYKLEFASEAHKLLENRKGGGSVYLVP